MPSFSLCRIGQLCIIAIFSGVLGGCSSTIFDAPYEDLPAVVATEGETELADGGLAIEPGDLHEILHGPHQPPKVYADLWERIRDGLQVADLDRDPAVQRATRRYLADKLFERMAQRSSGFLYYVVQSVEQRNLPMELVLLPFVESGFSLQAASTAEAHGAWQFIESTAKNYEIRIDRFRDDRRNLVISTRAALDYLSALYAQFGSWPLAMAAYNCGEKRVQAEVDRARLRGIKNPLFRDIAVRLPEETRDYVPRILALRQLVRSPEVYRLKLPEMKNAPDFSVVEIQRDMDVALVARLAGLKLEQLQRLNPSLTAPVIVGSQHASLLLPHAAALALSSNMLTHPGPWLSWRMVRIKRSASPVEIARRNQLPLRVVLQANPLPDGHYYAVGSTLMLPGRTADSGDHINPEMARQAVLLTRASSECVVLQSCSSTDEESGKSIPMATENGLPRRY
ncbi:MAG: transglycosylase SLT domain-containing protein [Dechloromonas sp.]|nr:transglycosylase SLT domain-containing protein [Dechloromonas sp.]